MKTIKSLLLSVTVLLLSVNVSAQIDLNKQAPTDPDIRTGKLDNGLTYFVRKNKEPEKRASFYIIQNVGAILENDSQNGLAHFLEHMAFNGTAHFPGKGIISGLEKHGVAFGREINAYTGFDETVYNLTNVPVDAPGLVDSCLLILNDWSHYLTLSDKEIDLERGVISEEWRTSKNAFRRMMFEVIPVILKDSKYATRDILGDLNVIKTFPYDTLRNFYHNWYRTDLQAIAVVGDFDVNEVEAKIKTMFSSIPPVKNPAPRNEVIVPYHKETNFVLAQDKEAPRTSVSVIVLHDAVPPAAKNLQYLRDGHVIYLMNAMINTRISELLQKENPPFVSGSVSFGGYYARGYDAFSINAIARKNEESSALEAIYTEAARARKFGFTKGELDRAKAEMLSDYENSFKQKDKIDNDTYVEGIQNNFLTGEPLTSIDFDFEFLKQVIDGITPEETSKRFRELMIDENRTIVVQGLEGDDIRHLTKEEALNIISKVNNYILKPYEDKALGESLINEELKGSEIAKTVPLPQFDAEEWTLGNNTKVIYKKADFEKDNVILSAFSFGGISKLDNDLVLSANLFPAIIQMYGAGDYDNIALQKMLSGKKASVGFGLSETAESISGSSTPKDFETMMQLLYLRMAHPRFDKVAHDAIIGRYAAMIASMEKDPNKIKSDSISLITTGYNPRTPILTKESINNITLDKIQKIYTDRFNGADEFTFFIVGNIEKETVIPMVKKYIGSLPSKARKETWIDRKVEQPEGRITKEITIPLTIPKSTVFISFADDFKYNPKNYLGLEVINGILDIVYTEKVREDEGGTYGVGVSLSAQKRPVEIGEGMINFDCDPARANDLKAIIYRELDNIMKNGPSRENLDKAVNNMLKNREENKMHNAYWNSILTRYYSYGINSNDPENYENILKSFTVNDIKKIASKMFSKADVVDLIFKPEK
ncbi:MAG TPA: insulinase family protein [Bacteroidales bacterium]|nr:insulinase family protein [Bacteroidales bacterium]HPT21037.1 insulinase family protein [Bacteroidales bacterium]